MATKRNVGAWLSGKTLLALALLAISGCMLWESGAEAPGVAYVDTFDLSGATCGLGKQMQAKKSVGGRALTVGGKTYGVKQMINGEAVAYYSKLANPSTATGNPAIPGKTIAVDPRVIPLGSLVYVTSVDGVSWSYGPAYAHDVGGGIKGNIIDLFKASYDECVAHGRRDCIIYILEL